MSSHVVAAVKYFMLAFCKFPVSVGTPSSSFLMSNIQLKVKEYFVPEADRCFVRMVEVETV